MKYLWFLPAEYVPAIATLMIVFSGVALILQQKALGKVLFISAILLVISPAFDPFFDSVIDSGFQIGAYYIHQWSWWVVAIVALVAVLLILKLVISFIFGEGTAKATVADLLAGLIRFSFPVLLIVAAYLYFTQ